MLVLTVKRWTRYGKDRLYVSTEDGQRVGWLDLLTGQEVIERPDLAQHFQTVLAAYRGTEVSVATQPDDDPADGSSEHLIVPVQRESDYAVSMEWTDLAANRSGQAVRAEAEALLAGMRAQSKVGTFFKRALDVKTDERAFRVGAAGEEAVGPRLERLVKHGWHVLHSIPVGKGKSDIDHLLVGSGGVYTVNTKNHPGGKVWVGEHAIRVNGQPTHYLRNSRFEAKRVSKALRHHLGEEVPVRAVLVFLTCTVIPQVTIRQMPDVLVLDRMDIPRIFKRSPERLTPEAVERVYAIARRSTTWVPAG